MRSLMVLLVLQSAASAGDQRNLARADVVAAMTALRPALDACASRHHAAGFTVVKLTIAAAGTVAGAAIDPSVAGAGDVGADSDAGRCIVAAVRSARVPPFDGPAQTISYPLVVGAPAAGDTLVRAQDAYVAGRFDEAIALAQAARADDPPRAWRIIGAASCFVGRGAEAAAAVRALDEPGRRFVTFVCAKHHVALGAR